MEISSVIAQAVDDFFTSHRWIMISIFVWGIIDTIMLLRKGGKLKRGFIIWRRRLSRNERLYLRHLASIYVPERKISTEQGFIKVSDREALISYRRIFWKTSWPYIGYVDLSKQRAFLEFRGSLPMHLFFVPFILSIWGIPFVALMIFLDFAVETSGIEIFLRDQVRQYRTETENEHSHNTLLTDLIAQPHRQLSEKD